MSENGQTIASLLREATARLSTSASGIATPRLDAEVLLMSTLGVAREDLILAPGKVPDMEMAARFEAALARRLKGEPVAYITGHREFFGLDFHVSPAVLIPRPDSETLVEAAREKLGRPGTPPSPRILDLGTGSGCLLLSLLHLHPGAIGVGIDQSAAALAVAAQNAESLALSSRVTFYEGDWYAALPDDAPAFDLLISNPPYIRNAEIPALMPDVADHEPIAALAGGPDGLDACRAIARGARDWLRPGGFVLLEVGIGQSGEVREILEKSGLKFSAIRHDLAGIARVLIASR